MNPTTLTYQDVDGDDVTVRFSKAFLNAGNANSVFTFDAGTVNGSNTGKQQLQRIDLTVVPASAGTGVTVTATANKLNGGDGFAALGELKANGLDLASVTIDGDLGRVLAGDATTKTAGLVSLTAQSIGRFGTTTGAMDLHSVIQGRLGTLNVKGDVKEAFIDVKGAADALIGAVTIGGSVVGGLASNSGQIYAEAAIGAVTIKGDLIGGAGLTSGLIEGVNQIGALTIGGSIRGGGGAGSGQIFTFGSMGPVTVAGNVYGGTGASSGEVTADVKLAAITIGGSLVGGAGVHSGRIVTHECGSVRVGGDIIGGSGEESGRIESNGSLGNVTIGGSLLGGTGTSSGRIDAPTKLGSVKVGGSVVGNADGSGIIASDKIAGVTIGGSLLGGVGTTQGAIKAGAELGAVRIAGNMIGGVGGYSGWIDATGKIASVTIGGSLTSDGKFGGRITSGGDLGTLKIGGSLLGTEFDTASVYVSGKIGSVIVGGSVKGGTDRFSGRIHGGMITMMTIGGDIVGGTTLNVLDEQQDSGYIDAVHIGAMTVGGSVIATPKTNNAGVTFDHCGAIAVLHDIGTLTIKGNLVGDPTNRAIISARGQISPIGTKDVAIGSLTIGGRVENAIIRGGYSKSGNATNADAQIGKVTVGGDWIASSMLVGLMDANFNNKDVAAVHSKIGSLTIGGQMLGTTSGGDLFIIRSNEIGSLRVGGTFFKLTAGALNDALALSPTNDLVVVEMA